MTDYFYFTYVILKYFFSPPPKRRKVVEFFICLCSDVLLEVLRWGNRYHLAALEENGRSFHYLIDRYFKEAPFLRLNLELNPSYLFSYFFFNIKFR